MRQFSWKITAAAVVIALAIIYTLPTLKSDLWPYKKIDLGLDLQGGMHLVLEVDTKKAVEGALSRLAEEIRSSMRKEQILYKNIELVDSVKISASIQEQDIDKFNSLLDKEFINLRILSKNQEGSIYNLIMDLPDAETEKIKKSSVSQAIETIRNRIDQFGVNEPDIRKQGEKRILIQLPGIKEPKRAKEIIGKTALLEFKLVDEIHDVDKALKGEVYPGSEVLFKVEDDPQTRRTVKTPFLIKKKSLLTGADLTEARVEIDSRYNEPYVSIKFNAKGGRIFETITAENIKKRLAIILDNHVYSAPVIQDKISGGQASITGRFSMEEARDLAIVLRAGALPAPVNIIEERTVGPSLGADSIKDGLFSMMIGGLLVVLFMILYYKGAGLIADLALILNIILIAAGLACFQATLTLPGIAGIILTIGMAVDANVLIFERIKEELRIGKTVHSAVSGGYSRAALTILDANITTLIAAIVLFQFGTGPVKGFAVTLSLGVISSLFTALILTRVVFDYLIIKRNIKVLSI